MSGPIEVPLSAPVKAHGEQLTKLSLRPPTGKDLRICGNPFRMRAEEGNATASPVFDSAASAKMLSELAGVPLSTIDQLPARDFFKAQMTLLDFFGEETPTTS